MYCFCYPENTQRQGWGQRLRSKWRTTDQAVSHTARGRRRHWIEPGRKCTPQTQIVICLGSFLTATVPLMMGDTQSNWLYFIYLIQYIDWLFSYVRGGVRYISVNAALAFSRNGYVKSQNLSVITVSVPAEIWSDQFPHTSQQLYCLKRVPSLNSYYVHIQGQVIVQWEFPGTNRIWCTYQRNHKVVTSPCALRQ
jgi:hypothetical protein